MSEIVSVQIGQSLPPERWELAGQIRGAGNEGLRSVDHRGKVIRDTDEKRRVAE